MDNSREVEQALKASVVLHVVIFLSIIGLTYAGGQEKRRVLMEVEIVSAVRPTTTTVERPREPQRVAVARVPIAPLVVRAQKKVEPPQPQLKHPPKNQSAPQPTKSVPSPGLLPPEPKRNPEPPPPVIPKTETPPVHSDEPPKPAPASNPHPPAANSSGSGGESKPAVIASQSGTPSGSTGGSGGNGTSDGSSGGSKQGSGTVGTSANVTGGPSGLAGGGKRGGSGSGGQNESVKETPQPRSLVARDSVAERQAAFPPKVETSAVPPPPMELKREEPKREEPKREEPKREEPLTQAKPKYRSNPKPDYPSEARRQKLEGVVYLLVSINARGRVEDVQIDQSSGFGVLDEAALKAVRRWEFEPARRGDTPVATRVRVPIRFKLE